MAVATQWLARASLGVIALTIVTGCAYKSDAQYSADQSRREGERGLQSMRTATQQTQRGTDLAGDTLRAALSGKTLVNRYELRPGGPRGAYVIRRHFAADGRYVVVDEPNVAGARSDDTHRWRVEGPQLCMKGPPWPAEWKCYRMARTAAGALQWFIDDPGSPYDRQLTIVTSEIMDGPPR